MSDGWSNAPDAVMRWVCADLSETVPGLRIRWSEAQIRYVKSEAKGVCVRCHGSAATRGKHCDRCAEKNRLRMQAHRANTGAA